MNSILDAGVLILTAGSAGLLISGFALCMLEALARPASGARRSTDGLMARLLRQPRRPAPRGLGGHNRRHAAG